MRKNTQYLRYKKNFVRFFMSIPSVPSRQHRSAYNVAKRNSKIKFYYLLQASIGCSEFIDKYR